LRVHHDAEPVLIGLIGIVVISDARIIGKCRCIIAGNAAALAVDMTEIPIGDNISILGGPAEKLDRTVEVPVVVGLLGLL
jgi:xanthosine utilization system XapX-like protein